MTCSCDGSGRIPIDGKAGADSMHYLVCPCQHPQPSTRAARMAPQTDPQIQVSR